MCDENHTNLARGKIKTAVQKNNNNNKKLLQRSLQLPTLLVGMHNNKNQLSELSKKKKDIKTKIEKKKIKRNDAVRNKQAKWSVSATCSQKELLFR